MSYTSTVMVSLALLAAAGWGCASPNAVQPADARPPQRPEFEALAQQLRDSDNAWVGMAQVPPLERELAQTQPPAARAQTFFSLAWHHVRLGEIDAAIARIEEALTLARSGGADDETRGEIMFLRGVIYVRQAEVGNCILRHNKDCCILPLAGGGIHGQPGPARSARAAFEEYLAELPRNAKVAWLLNIVAMAIGDWPDAVPERYRIPREAFVSEYEVGRFEDVAPALGVDRFANAGAVVADDFDGDGLIDVVASTSDPGGSMIHYRNRGDGTFEDVTARSRLDDQLGGLNVVGTDYDNDGDVDLFVLRGAWLFDAGGRMRRSLLRNEKDGTFTDVTREAGLAEPTRPSQAAAWGDYDGDGDLDVFVGNESPENDPTRYPSQLFRNNGDGTFTDVAAEAGVLNHSYAKGVAAGDYDDDGDLDLYVSNIGPNRLYRNEGGMRFVDVAPSLGMEHPTGRSFATWFFDFDNDSDLDLYVGAYDATVADIWHDLRGEPDGATRPCLYRNNGDGTFTDVALDVGFDHAWLPMGANFGDLDNDGWLDFYLGTGDPLYVSIMPNVMLRNDLGRRFQNVTTSAGTGHLQKGHGVAFADFDEDGDQDLYHQLGGFYPGDRFKSALFANPGHGNHFLVLKLAGTRSAASAYGARITVVVRTAEGERRIHRAVGSVSSFGGSPQRQEIGLGRAESIREVEIVWPTSGERQVFHDVPLDAKLRVVEGAERYEVLSPPRADLLEAARRKR